MATKLKIERRGDEILIVHCCFSELQFMKNPVIYAKKLIIMLTQFTFGHILA
jgi:hypothetical protein